MLKAVWKGGLTSWFNEKAVARCVGARLSPDLPRIRPLVYTISSISLQAQAAGPRPQSQFAIATGSRSYKLESDELVGCLIRILSRWALLINIRFVL
jgi:hypothetical protein